MAQNHAIGPICICPHKNGVATPARGRVWAGQLTHDYSFGIYFNRIAAANSPLEKGNRPNPKHTTSFQVILTAEGAVKMCVAWY